HGKLQGEGSVENKVCGSGQRDIAEFPAVLGESNLKGVSAANPNGNGRRIAGSQVVQDGRGAHARAAGQRFAFHAAFVGADGDGGGTRDGGKVGIRSLGRKSLVIAEGRAVAPYVDCFQVGHKNHGVRHTGVEEI